MPENENAPVTNREAEKNTAVQKPMDKNAVTLKGQILSIGESFDTDTQRSQTVLKLSNVNVNRDGTRQKIVLEVSWSDETRKLLDGFHAGEHVKLLAECSRFYRLHGRAIEPLEKEDNEFGIGDYPEDSNKCVFIGKYNGLAIPENDPNVGYLRILINGAFENELSFRLGYRPLSIFKENAAKFNEGETIGVVCRIYLRPVEEGQSERVQRVYFNVLGFVYVDEEGKLQSIAIPAPVRRVRRNRPAQRRRVDATSAAQEDLRHPDPEEPSLNQEETVIPAEEPAIENETNEQPAQEVAEEVRHSGLSPDEILERNQRLAMERIRGMTTD